LILAEKILVFLSSFNKSTSSYSIYVTLKVWSRSSGLRLTKNNICDTKWI